MATICPTVTAYDLPGFNKQLERAASFAQRVHLDFMDGIFAPTKSPSLKDVNVPQHLVVDLHIMYRHALSELEIIERLRPHLVIVHAESKGDFLLFAQRMRAAGIKTGVALLKKTDPGLLRPALSMIDHVLIFSGDLGHFGGQADLSLLKKVKELKQFKRELEIGWDGGINDANVVNLVRSGVDVLNVGGFIQNAQNPQAAYATLKDITDKITV